MVQIFEKVKFELDKVGARALPGGMILTGGAAALPGAIELAEDTFEIPVKLYIPHQMGLRYPAFTTGIGLIQYEANLDDIHQIMKEYQLGVTRSEDSSYNVKSENFPENDEHSFLEYEKEKPLKKEKKQEDKWSNKAKNFISNFFD